MAGLKVTKTSLTTLRSTLTLFNIIKIFFSLGISFKRKNTCQWDLRGIFSTFYHTFYQYKKLSNQKENLIIYAFTPYNIYGLQCASSELALGITACNRCVPGLHWVQQIFTGNPIIPGGCVSCKLVTYTHCKLIDQSSKLTCIKFQTAD